MFIDYLPMMLVNMAAGLFVLAWFWCRGMDNPDQRAWAPAFGAPEKNGEFFL